MPRAAVEGYPPHADQRGAAGGRGNHPQGLFSDHGHSIGLRRQGGSHSHHHHQFIVQGMQCCRTSATLAHRLVQVVSQNSALLAPLCVDAVLHIGDLSSSSADLRNIKVCDGVAFEMLPWLHLCAQSCTVGCQEIRRYC
jgi:hypothetical protein